HYSTSAEWVTPIWRSKLPSPLWGEGLGVRKRLSRSGRTFNKGTPERGRGSIHQIHSNLSTKPRVRGRSLIVSLPANLGYRAALSAHIARESSSTHFGQNMHRARYRGTRREVTAGAADECEVCVARPSGGSCGRSGWGAAAQNPWVSTPSAALNLLERFWNAIRAVNSTMASSSKWRRKRAKCSADGCRSEHVTASA